MVICFKWPSEPQRKEIAHVLFYEKKIIQQIPSWKFKKRQQKLATNEHGNMHYFFLISMIQSVIY